MSYNGYDDHPPKAGYSAGDLKRLKKFEKAKALSVKRLFKGIRTNTLIPKISEEDYNDIIKMGETPIANYYFSNIANISFYRKYVRQMKRLEKWRKKQTKLQEEQNNELSNE